MKTKSTRFSWIFDGADEASRPHYDEIIHESKSFVVIPSVGSLVSGWVLIIPKRPVANFSMLNRIEAEELESVSEDVSRLLSRFAGNIYVFEHGGPIGSSVSCGVDQAHLHMVPLRFNLLAAACKQSDYEWSRFSGVEALPRLIGHEDEYLYMRSEREAYYTKLDEPVSQWYRRLIAKGIGKPLQWNYRQHPNLSNVDQTLRVLAA